MKKVIEELIIIAGIVAVVIVITMLLTWDTQKTEDEKETLPYDVMFFQFSDYVGDYIIVDNSNLVYYSNGFIAGILLYFNHSDVFVKWDNIDFDKYADDEFITWCDCFFSNDTWYCGYELATIKNNPDV